jgi:phage protein D
MPAIVIGESEICSFQMRLADRAKYGMVIGKYHDFDAAEEKQVSVGNESPIFTLRDTYTSAAQAQARATAKLAEIKSGTKTLSLDLIGNPFICAESVLEIPNLRPEIAGRWVVKSTRHNLSSGGYKTAVEAVKPKGE